MMYLGDYVEDEPVYFLWSSNGADGAAITRATNGTVSVYKDNGTTQTTEGVTDTEDFDSVTGIHACSIVTTNAFYVTGADYAVVLSAATIDGKTVNAVLAHFSIQNRYMRGTNSANTTTPPTAVAIADQVWDEATSGHVTAGTAGKAIVDTLEDTGTTLPATLTTIDGIVDDILVDTGTTLPAAIDDIEAGGGGTAPTASQNAAAVWSTALGSHAAGTAGHKLSLVALASQLQAAVASGAVSTSIANAKDIVRYATYEVAITNLGDITGRDELYVAIKTAVDDTDDDSIVLWQETVGLAVLNAEEATSATDGTITVDDADTGDITLTLTVDAASEIPEGTYTIAAKVVKTDGTITPLGDGTIKVTESIIKAVS